MTAAVSLPAFRLRVAVEDDRNYILSTWRRSERESKGAAEGAYFATLQGGEMRAVLDRESTSVTIAHPESSPETILGWCALRAPVTVVHKGPIVRREIGPAPIVYFVHVRPELRRVGVAALLLAELADRKDVLYTSRPARTRDGARWVPSAVPIPSAWRYCPRAAFVEVP